MGSSFQQTLTRQLNWIHIVRTEWSSSVTPSQALCICDRDNGWREKGHNLKTENLCHQHRLFVYVRVIHTTTTANGAPGLPSVSSRNSHGSRQWVMTVPPRNSFPDQLEVWSLLEHTFSTLNVFAVCWSLMANTPGELHNSMRLTSKKQGNNTTALFALRSE